MKEKVINLKDELLIIQSEKKNICITTRTCDSKRNPGKNPGMGSIPLKFILIFKQTQRAVELSIGQVLEAVQNQLVLIALPEATCILSIGHRLMIPYTGEGMDKVRVDTWEIDVGINRMWRFSHWEVFITFFAGQSDSKQEQIQVGVV